MVTAATAPVGTADAAPAAVVAVAVAVAGVAAVGVAGVAGVGGGCAAGGAGMNCCGKVAMPLAATLAGMLPKVPFGDRGEVFVVELKEGRLACSSVWIL